jgi:hypothetical protein
MAEGAEPSIAPVSPDFLVIAKTNEHLSHVRAIDSGSFGEVHEVNQHRPHFNVALMRKVRNPESGQVCPPYHILSEVPHS